MNKMNQLVNIDIATESVITAVNNLLSKDCYYAKSFKVLKNGFHDETITLEVSADDGENWVGESVNSVATKLNYGCYYVDIFTAIKNWCKIQIDSMHSPIILSELRMVEELMDIADGAIKTMLLLNESLLNDIVTTHNAIVGDSKRLDDLLLVKPL